MKAVTDAEASGSRERCVPLDPAPPDPSEQQGNPEASARIICLRLLDRSARTRAELSAALGKRGIPDDAAAKVLDRFAAVGLIDDAALADNYALAQHQERGLASRAVAVKLRRRGVSDETLQAALEQIDPASEAATAKALVERKLRSLGGLDPQVQARRLVGLLGRKGYPPGLAYRTVREALADFAELADPANLDADGPVDLD
jgi:regulatory protein